MSNLRDRILSSIGTRMAVTLNGYGECYVREPSAFEIKQIEGKVGDIASTLKMDRDLAFNTMVIQQLIVDGDNQQIFSVDDLKQIADLPQSVYIKLAETVQKQCTAEVDIEAKKSEAVPN